MPTKIKRPDVWKFICSYKDYLNKRLAPWERVWKVTLDGGFTCPNLDGTLGFGGCIYCNNEGFSPAFGQAHQSLFEQFAPQAAKYKQAYKAKKFIAYFQPFTNTYAPIQTLKKIYYEALTLPDVVGICIGTRPDCVSLEVIDLLEEIAQKGYYVCLELGLQSAHDLTLKRMNRHHTFAQFTQTMLWCQNKSFDVCLHLVLGLPGETSLDWVQTALALSPFTFQSIKIHPIHVVKNTRLARIWKSGHFEPITLNAFVQGLADVLEHLHPKVAIQRLHGDSHGEFHLAPFWTGNKQEIEWALACEFLKRQSQQGTLYKKAHLL